MEINKEDVERVAKLARLEISESEKDTFSRQLSSILTYVDQLKGIDTAGIDPTATVLEQTNVFREDVVRPGLSAERALANAPDARDGYLQVPRILDER